MRTARACPPIRPAFPASAALHIADLVTVASSYIRAWIPAVEALGAKIAYSLAVVDRDQGGSKIALSDAGCPLTTLVVIKPELFETARKLGRISDKQLALVLHFIEDRMRSCAASCWRTELPRR